MTRFIVDVPGGRGTYRGGLQTGRLERHNSVIINGSRRKRIALGSGTTVKEVNNLFRQHTQMSKLFKGMGSMAGGGGMKAQQRLMAQVQGKQNFGR